MKNFVEVTLAKKIAHDLFGLTGEIIPQVGYEDFNFRVKTERGDYILKISRPDADPAYLDYQQQILQHIKGTKGLDQFPLTFPDINGNYISSFQDENGNTRLVRLLSWIDGRLWSSVNPITADLLNKLGIEAGKITSALKDFDHPEAHRELEWDLAQALWTKKHLHLFAERQQELVLHFLNHFEQNLPEYNLLRKRVIHNDVNDNNILVSDGKYSAEADFTPPTVSAIIDYGDAIHTQAINDLAIVLAYALMDKPDPLNAAQPILSGYHQEFKLEEAELKHLYYLVGIRLVISATNSALGKQKDPNNKYLQLSEKPAWDLLEKWSKIDADYAHYFFRKACDYEAHPRSAEIKTWLKDQQKTIVDLFPTLNKYQPKYIDLSVGSTWLGHSTEFQDPTKYDLKFKHHLLENPNEIPVGGYLEARPFYSTSAYQKEGNTGPEYRSVHLGADFWVAANTPLHAPLDGIVYSVYNNDLHKDYGPTIILKHQTDSGIYFYSLYGHLSHSSLEYIKVGASIKAGQQIGFIGELNENGHWPPHLHFQLILDMLGNAHDFPGVCYPTEKEIWADLCPDPIILFQIPELKNIDPSSTEDILDFRKKHLGKSLSLSYNQPLKMVRGEGQYLIDDTGRKYLDTINNVAHVGHEHPAVVRAGQAQMALLNTNTRYLHENINQFAAELLSTFPKALSVVHFVNSGSEANELAIRMAKAYTGQKDILAVEIGYHGNTNTCIDISSYKFDGKGGKGCPEHTHIVPLPDTFRGIYSGPDAGKKYSKHIQDRIEEVQSKDRNIAAFICESIISCGGQIESPPGYLAAAYKKVRAAGGLCIADEVQTGCGRVGKTFWGFQLHDVVPDIVTIGKPIGNGHPLAAVVCTQEVADAFANGMEYFNTFGGNPVSCAIGLEVLKVIKREKLQKQALEVGTFLKQGLQQLSQTYPIIRDIRGQGLFLGFELVDEAKNPLANQASYLANRMKEYGILMSTDGKDHNALKIKPPMCFNLENAQEVLSRLERLFQEDFMKI